MMVTSPASSSLSPFAPLFISGRSSEGLSKFRRWAEDSLDCSDEDYSLEKSSPKAPTFLDVVR
jgi:hypothetical protein